MIGKWLWIKLLSSFTLQREQSDERFYFFHLVYTHIVLWQLSPKKLLTPFKFCQICFFSHSLESPPGCDIALFKSILTKSTVFLLTRKKARFPGKGSVKTLLILVPLQSRTLSKSPPPHPGLPYLPGSCPGLILNL